MATKKIKVPAKSKAHLELLLVKEKGKVRPIWIQNEMNETDIFAAVDAFRQEMKLSDEQFDKLFPALVLSWLTAASTSKLAPHLQEPFAYQAQNAEGTPSYWFAFGNGSIKDGAEFIQKECRKQEVANNLKDAIKSKLENKANE